MFNFKALYQYRFKDVDVESKEAVWSEISSYIWGIAKKPKRVLDPAAGMGEFIKTIPAEEKWVVDLEDYCQWDRVKNVKFLKGSIFDVELPQKYFDCIFVSNFLEHLNNVGEIQVLLNKLRESLAPNGVLIVMGPNFKYCFKEYFDFADHIIPLTDMSIKEHLISAGFNDISGVAKFLPYSFKSILPANRMLTKIYLLIPLAWKLLGKQFLIIGKVE